MDIYKLKLTKLQQAIMGYLFVKCGMSFTARALAKALSFSPTAIAKALIGLQKEGILKVVKDKASGRLSIQLNRDSTRVFYLKRVENLKMVYESGLVEYLADCFPAATIVLFGSYSFGEDTMTSDIDIAIIGAKEQDLDLTSFSKLLEREIRLNFYENIGKISKNLRESILNGIVLKGSIKL